MTEPRNKPGAVVFGILVGLAAAVVVYRWVMAPDPQPARELEESAVLAARRQLVEVVDAGALEIVDPLAPDRKVGKAYVYPTADGWEVSGFYRRNESDLWHPYLMHLDASLHRTYLRISDQEPRLVRQGRDDPSLDVLP